MDKSSPTFLYSLYSSLLPCLASLFCSSSGIPLRKRRVEAVNTDMVIVSTGDTGHHYNPPGDSSPAHCSALAMEADTSHRPSHTQISPK